MLDTDLYPRAAAVIINTLSCKHNIYSHNMLTMNILSTHSVLFAFTLILQLNNVIIYSLTGLFIRNPKPHPDFSKTSRLRVFETNKMPACTYPEVNQIKTVESRRRGNKETQDTHAVRIRIVQDKNSSTNLSDRFPSCRKPLIKNLNM